MEFTTTPRTSVSSETVHNALNWRYATKHLDPVKELSDEEWNTLEESLVLSPSSYGLQPWRFIVIKNMAVRALLRAGNPRQDQSQITECSHLVVFAAKQKMYGVDIQRHMDRIAEVRKISPHTLFSYKKMMMDDVVQGPVSKAPFEWAARQCYIALGNLISTAAMMGIDTCPMDGINHAAFDKILELNGYSTVVACAVGFRCPDDKYFHLKKVRYPANETVVRLY